MMKMIDFFEGTSTYKWEEEWYKKCNRYLKEWAQGNNGENKWKEMIELTGRTEDEKYAPNDTSS